MNRISALPVRRLTVRLSANDETVTVRTVVLILGAALVAWIVTVARMRGMDEGPGTDLGGLGWFVGIWLTMTAAMMLPSTLPMLSTYARVARPPRTAMFVLGYLAAWTAFGLAAYVACSSLASVAPEWDSGGAWLAGGAIAAAGLYQLTPLKQACLRHCRGPLRFVVDGRAGALRMGAEHGGYCVGCCWGLMAALFALGVMSLFWTAVVGAAIFAEKVLPRGERLAAAVAVALVVLGLAVALAGGDVPGLTQPAPMEMER
jgi:predicted metal-binding membrane protein